MKNFSGKNNSLVMCNLPIGILHITLSSISLVMLAARTYKIWLQEARGRGSNFTIHELSYNRIALHYINKSWEIVPNSLKKNISYRAIHYMQTQLYNLSFNFVKTVKKEFKE